jgi:hypothetical protein
VTLFKGSKALKSTLLPFERPRRCRKRAREQRVSKEAQLLEGKKTLKRLTPRTLGPETRFRGSRRSKALRG